MREGRSRPRATERQIEGRNAVREALRAQRPLHRLYVARGPHQGPLRELVAQARAAGVTLLEVERDRLDAMSQTGRHQGVIAVAAARSYATVDECLARARAAEEDPLLVVCDGVEDPQNLGALLRVADATGVHGVVIRERRSVGLTAAVSRASAGAIEHVAVARVTNLGRALEDLKRAGLWVVGAHQEGPERLYEKDLRGPLAVVVGGEGRGIAPLLQAACDWLVAVPMRGRVNSLNASVAAAVILYEVVRQRAAGGRPRA